MIKFQDHGYPQDTQDVSWACQPMLRCYGPADQHRLVLEQVPPLPCQELTGLQAKDGWLRHQRNFWIDGTTDIIDNSI